MYKRKTVDIWEIQSLYFGVWETETTETTKTAARIQYKAYCENVPNIPHRIIKRRIPIQTATE